MLAFSDACAIATRQLEASGIAPVDIDAGYPLNGWRLFAHPEHLPAHADRWHDVPFVTSKRSTRYVIASTPLPGAEVLRVIPLERVTWQTTRTIYVMRRW